MKLKTLFNMSWHGLPLMSRLEWSQKEIFVGLLIIFSFIRAFIICPFAWNFKLSKFVKYTIDETKDFVKDYNDLVVIQPFTNDLKTMTPQNCVQSLQTLIVDIQHKWPNTEIIVTFWYLKKQTALFHVHPWHLKYQ
jgi:hypothetical protein